MMAHEFKGELPKSVSAAVLSGKGVFFGEFRTGVASEFTSRGNKVFKKSTCTVETAGGVVTVNEFLPDSMDVKAWKPPFPKGTMVFGEVSGWETASGAQVAMGKLFAA